MDSPILKSKRKGEYGDLAYSYLGPIPGFVDFTALFSSVFSIDNDVNYFF